MGGARTATAERAAAARERNPKQTLEPRGQGLRFLSPLRNWLGVALMLVGGILLLFGMR